MHRYSPLTRKSWRTIHQLTYKRLSDSQYTVTRMQRSLCAFGFPVGRVDGKVGPATRSAVEYFQAAYNGGRTGGPLLVVDGVPGPRTKTALRQLPHLSPHFTALEVACHDRDADAFIKRELLQTLETLRTHLGHPLSVISAYRSPAHNKAVGGATRSRHLYGEAADISRRNNLHLNTAKSYGLWSGLGYLTRSKRVTHVDVRHTSGNGTVTNPRQWAYPE